MKHISRPLPFLFRLRNDRSGTAAVELGLVASMLVLILVPMFDLGMGAYQKMRVQNAAEAGAQYALGHGYSSTAITSAAQNATTLGTNVAVTPGQACDCINSGSVSASPGSATPPCTGTCSDGSNPGTFVTVNTSVSYTPLVSYSRITGLSGPMTLRGTAVVRIN